jgi:hypothetical protein
LHEDSVVGHHQADEPLPAERLPQVDQALIFHIGLGAVLAERSRGEMEDPADQEQVTSSWRRFRQAIESMNDAHESEDFQAVGVKCRDSLISLARDHAGDEWVGEVQDPPKAADFKGWANIFADQLTDAGRLRSYLKALIDKTWGLTVWLQHNSNATPVDADLVLEATGNLITTLAKLIRRKEYGEPDRCPDCESYRVDESIDDDEDKEGSGLGMNAAPAVGSPSRCSRRGKTTSSALV